MSLKLLDLFCKAGGASIGYERAGFLVRGIDIEPQPHYPCEFRQADALDPTQYADWLEWADVIHASPPCQAYSAGKRLAIGRGVVVEHPDLIAPTRALLQSTGKPYIIENVPGAPLIAPVQVCGSYFGLRITKERLFESNLPLWGAPCQHVGTVKERNLPDDADGYYWRCYGHERNVELWRAAMGCDWMTREEAANAIPPVFTEYIGEQLIGHLRQRAS